MSELEIKCKQKPAEYIDGWDHPEDIINNTDDFEQLSNCYSNEDHEYNDETGKENTITESSHDSDMKLENKLLEEDFNEPEIDNQNLICSIIEKSTFTKEIHEPNSVHNETGKLVFSKTTTKITKKYRE